MRLLGNIFWFLLGGWLIGLVYLLGAIVFFPLLPFLIKFVGFSFFPFGRTVVSREKLEAYQRAHGKEISGSQKAVNVIGTVGNLLWALTFGWVLFLLHLFACLANLAVFWLIVTIPNIAGHWKLMFVAFAPFNLVIINSDLAKEIELEAARAKILA